MKDNFQDKVEDNLNALVAVGTLMNQLGRLDPDDLLQKDAVETVRTALNQLFKDYIEAQQPESEFPNDIEITHDHLCQIRQQDGDDETCTCAERQLFSMVHQWGKVGVVADHTSNAYKAQMQYIKDQALQQYKSNLLEGLSDE